MTHDERKLCCEFLSKGVGGTNREAKTTFASMDKQKKDVLLKDAKAWKAKYEPAEVIERIVNIRHMPPKDDALTNIATVDTTAHAAPTKRPTKEKKTPYTLLIQPSTLETLRKLSEADGAPVSHHIRQAIKMYLKEKVV